MLKLKHNIRWIIPLVILALAIACLVVAHPLGAHAAAATPDLWNGH